MFIFNILKEIKKKFIFKINFIKKEKRKKVVLRSPFVNKKSREQFFIENYKFNIKIDSDLTNIFIINYFENILTKLFSTCSYTNNTIKKKLFIN